MPLSGHLEPLSKGYRSQTLLRSCTSFDILKLTLEIRGFSGNILVGRLDRHSKTMRHPLGDLDVIELFILVSREKGQ